MIRTFISQPESPNEGNFVKVMSLHKSKGLTSKVVIIPSTIHGLIPTVETTLEVAQQQLLLREQRRLFYVAITRTKEILLVSSIREMNIDLAFRIGAIGRRRVGRNKQLNIASQFISEFGPSAPNPKLGSTWVNNNYQ
jgi:superfamily I DNA/RNA helicase